MTEAEFRTIAEAFLPSAPVYSYGKDCFIAETSSHRIEYHGQDKLPWCFMVKEEGLEWWGRCLIHAILGT